MIPAEGYGVEEGQLGEHRRWAWDWDCSGSRPSCARQTLLKRNHNESVKRIVQTDN